MLNRAVGNNSKDKRLKYKNVNSMTTDTVLFTPINSYVYKHFILKY